MNNHLLKTLNSICTSGKLNSITCNHVSEILDEAELDTVVLYKLQNQLKALDLFKDRLIKSKAEEIYLFCDQKIDIDTSKNIVQFKLSDYKVVSDLLINHFYPSSFDLKVIGITGTNGKSTVVHLCRNLCASEGIVAASIGTLGVFVNDKMVEETVNTTPGPIELAGIFHRLKTKYNAKYVFIEVSSHALAQERLGPFMLECAAWTSFGRDHLDYHKTIEEYFNAKTLILKKLKDTGLQKLIVPASDKMLINELEIRKVPYHPFSSKKLPQSMFFKIDYNQSNLAVALGVLAQLKIDISDESINNLDGPKGRFEIIKNKWGAIIVDYAHSPDGLDSVLKNVNKIYPHKKIGVLFGCGGDRDTGKRPLMGKVASELAHKVIVTSDNPRTEDPAIIINMIINGIDDKTKIVSIADRKSAIEAGFKMINKNEIDVLVVAGKGHEEYQEIKGHKKYFSDQGELLELIKRHENL
jgi:UDP-N-acetylmuramoyl-L-alanyl-D-glutamate--2,6-diaminopimelate ligase